MKYSIIIAAMLAVSVQASVTEGGRGIVHRKLAEYPDDSKLVVASYIVVFDDAIANVSTKSYEIMSLPYFTNATISNEYTASIKGISIDNVSGELLSKLLDDPQVSRVVPVS